MFGVFVVAACFKRGFAFNVVLTFMLLVASGCSQGPSNHNVETSENDIELVAVKPVVVGENVVDAIYGFDQLGTESLIYKNDAVLVNNIRLLAYSLNAEYVYFIEYEGLASDSWSLNAVSFLGDDLIEVHQSLDGEFVDCTVSPDGRYIAFTVQVLGGNKSLYLWDTQSTDSVFIFQYQHIEDLMWSKNNQLSVSRGSDNTSEIVIINPDAGEEIYVDDGQMGRIYSGSRSWSREGGKFQYLQERDGDEPIVRLFDLESSRSELLVDHPINQLYIRWAPDDNNLIYRESSNLLFDLILVDFSQNIHLNLTNFEPGFDAIWAEWSPNGEYVAYLFWEGAVGEFRVRVADRGGAVVSEVSEVEYLPAHHLKGLFWSPDSNYLAYVQKVGEGSIVSLLNVESGDVQLVGAINLTFQSQDLPVVSWSHSSRYFAYAKDWNLLCSYSFEQNSEECRELLNVRRGFGAVQILSWMNSEEDLVFVSGQEGQDMDGYRLSKSSANLEQISVIAEGVLSQDLNYDVWRASGFFD